MSLSDLKASKHKIMLYSFFFGLLLLDTVYVSSFVLDEQTDSNALKMLVQLQADVNSMKSKMNEIEESCACSTIKKQTEAFMASLGHDFTGATNQAVIFDRVQLNQGSAYDNRHGVFRAAKNGTYHFSATLTAAPLTSFHVAFVKNLASNHVGYVYADASQNFWQERSTSIMVSLSSGDDVWLSCLSASKISGDTDSVNNYQTYHSHFSGFMLSED